MTVDAPPSGLVRVLPASRITDIDEHHQRFGSLPPRTAALIDEVRRAGLLGRGGAAFPTGDKLAAVAARRWTAAVVVNATEGEPTSYKDKALLIQTPHLVIDGAVLAAAAVGAPEVVVVIERGHQTVAESVLRACSQRRDGVPVRVEEAPPGYLTGEESALVHWLNGGDAKPTSVPPRPFERGLRGRPTLIDNAETLAHVALIARHGAAWFRSVGTATAPGTRLVTISGGVARPGVLEVAIGSPLAEVIASAGVTDGIEAVLVGGYFGSWLAADHLDAAVIGPQGCGAVVVLRAGACGLIEGARVTRWLAAQSAGQCGPSAFGLPAIADAMDAVTAGGDTRRALGHLARWLPMVEGRGACKHPDGAVRFVESTLRVFADEVDRHRDRGPCAAGAPVCPTPRRGGWR